MEANIEGSLVVVYDDGCAFCRGAIAAIRARDRYQQFRYIPCSTAGLAKQYPLLDLQSIDTGIRLVEANGKIHIGSDAIYLIGTRLPYFRWFAWMYRLPVIKMVTRHVYAWFAAHRLQLSHYCRNGCELDASGKTASPDNVSHRKSGLQLVISIFILLVVGLHGWANMAKAILPSSIMGDRSWPFLAYGMYRYSFPPAIIRATKTNIVALTQAGRELKLEPEIIGMGGQALGRHFLSRIRRGDSSASRELADRIGIGRDDPVIGFRMDSEIFAIRESGIVLEGKESKTYLSGN